jgi:hypothetical protein
MPPILKINLRPGKTPLSTVVAFGRKPCFQKFEIMVNFVAHMIWS